MAKGPCLPNIAELIQAGIDPKTKLPLKMAGVGFDNGKVLLESITRFVRIIDEQDAIGRYKWYNLPCNISSLDLERMLYFRGQLAFFYHKETESFYFMPFALNGGIDVYGRYSKIRPIPLAGESVAIEESEKDKVNKPLRDYFAKSVLTPVYGIVVDDIQDEDMLTNSAVILYDYTRQLNNNTIIPRSVLNDSLIKTIAECVPLLRTALLNSTGIKGVRVNDGDQAKSVYDGAKSVYDAAINGEAFIPMIGTMEYQELSDSASGRAQDFLMSMQALDNIRLGGYGIDNGGIFEKKAHILESEAIMGSASVSIVYNEGLQLRQNFCNICNSIWDLGIWCEASESVLGIDQDQDGVAYDENESGEHGGVENDNE